MVPFRVRVTLVLALLFALGAAVGSLAVGARVAAVEQRDQGETLHSLARAAANAFAAGLADRARELQLLASTLPPGTAAQQAPAWQRVIDRVQATHRPWTWLGITDERGRVVAAGGGLMLGADASARPWARAGLERSFVSDVHDSVALRHHLPGARTEPLRLINVATPVPGLDGRASGVLAGHIDWTWARELIATLRSDAMREQGVEVFVLGRDGRVLHRPALAVAVVAPPAIAPGEPVMTEWDDGGAYLSVRVPVPAALPETDLGWTVVVRQPAEAALRGAHHARELVLAVGGLGVLAATAAAWIVLGLMSRPLQAMADAAGRIGRGETGTLLPRASGMREIDQFGAALDRMAQRLIEANRTLEARVAERTAALEQANAELEKLATHDALTGLFNRRAADARLAAEIARHRRTGAPLAVLMADIDHFKRINDGHGHAIGDRVLVRVAQRLREACRETDFVARTGGEEFLVLLPHTDDEGALAVAGKLLAAVSAQPVEPVGRVTLSIGVLPHAQRGSADLALQRADLALYDAKRSGRDRLRVAEAEPA